MNVVIFFLVEAANSRASYRKFRKFGFWWISSLTWILALGFKLTYSKVSVMLLRPSYSFVTYQRFMWHWFTFSVRKLSIIFIITCKILTWICLQITILLVYVFGEGPTIKFDTNLLQTIALCTILNKNFLVVVLNKISVIDFLNFCILRK